ncbi:MAG: 50S ribosomal protein L9 [Bacteroidota bacterium]
MKIILKQDLEHLGYKDDIVKVKDGYARNYLIPKGYAIIATEPNKKVLAENLKQRKFKEEKTITEVKSIAEALQGMVIKVGAKVSSKGKIFGSVTPLQIADAIEELGYNVDRKKITIQEEAIKTAGSYTANIKFHKEVEITINFDVVGE